MVTKNQEMIRNIPLVSFLRRMPQNLADWPKLLLSGWQVATPHPDPERERALAVALGTNSALIHEGTSVVISDGVAVVKCDARGTGWRCGGQSLGTFYCWTVLRVARDPPEHVSAFPQVLCCVCCMSAHQAEQPTSRCQEGPQCLTIDMLEEIHPVFEALFLKLKRTLCCKCSPLMQKYAYEFNL